MYLMPCWTFQALFNVLHVHLAPFNLVQVRRLAAFVLLEALLRLNHLLNVSNAAKVLSPLRIPVLAPHVQLEHLLLIQHLRLALNVLLALSHLLLGAFRAHLAYQAHTSTPLELLIVLGVKLEGFRVWLDRLPPVRLVLLEPLPRK